MSRLFGTIAIAIGVAIIVVSPGSWDHVFLTLPSGIDLHVYDAVGGAVVALGVVLFWR